MTAIGKEKRVVISVAAGPDYQKLLNVTMPAMRDYAQRVGAEFIPILDDEPTPWIMAAKYKMLDVAKDYDRALFLDADVVVSQHAPNIFDVVPDARLGVFDEYPILQGHGGGYEWVQREGDELCDSQGIARFPQTIMFNAGVFVIPRNLLHLYEPAPKPTPECWCSEQQWFTIKTLLSGHQPCYLDEKWNLSYVDRYFWQKTPSAHFIHINGSRPLEYRVTLLSRLVQRNFERLDPPRDIGFLPNWITNPLPSETLPDVPIPRTVSPRFVPEKCIVINLDRREDRLRQWYAQLPDPWPFPKPERFAAIDGRRVPVPPQWRCGGGAWGCLRSHALILEQCLTEGIDSYVVFEDDASFIDGFSDRYADYVNALPQDWQLAYLGGQNLYAGSHPPQRINEHVYRPYNVNRTHAFMVRDREAMKTIYRHLYWDGWKPKNHIDHHLGRLVQREYTAVVENKKVDKERLITFCPAVWLSGQLPSKSNICGKHFEDERLWNSAASIDPTDVPFFAVLGPHRSGTSCVAMILHHLGVHMGNELGGYEDTGGGEAVGLAQLCESVMRFPLVDPTITSEQLTARLKRFCQVKKIEARRKGTVAGGKYPHLCRFAPQLHEALGSSLRIIAVDRPIEASIRSLQDRSKRHPGEWFSADDEACETLQRSLLEHRDAFVQAHPDVPVHRIDFARLTLDPAAEIRKLIAFLGIESTQEETNAAIAHVNPQLRRFG